MYFVIYRYRWDVLAPSTLLFSQSTSGMFYNVRGIENTKTASRAKTIRILQENCKRTIYLISDGETDKP
jgi:hypothetical protein